MSHQNFPRVPPRVEEGSDVACLQGIDLEGDVWSSNPPQFMRHGRHRLAGVNCVVDAAIVHRPRSSDVPFDGPDQIFLLFWRGADVSGMVVQLAGHD